MGRPLALEQSDDDEDDEDKDKEGDSQANVEGEVRCGELVSLVRGRMVRILDQHRHLAWPARWPAAVSADKVLAWAVGTSIGRGGLTAAPPPHLQTVCGAAGP